MYRIVEKENLAPGIKRIKVEAPLDSQKNHARKLLSFSGLMKLMKESP